MTYGTAELTFNPPSDTGGAAITGYQANCTSSASETSSPQATGSASPILVQELTNGVPYTCTVSAVNTAGAGPSASVTGTTLTATSPSAPNLTSATNNPVDDVAEISLAYDVSTITIGSDTLTSASAACVSTNSSIFRIVPASGTVKLEGPPQSGSYTYSCTVQVTNSAGLISPASNSLNTD
jgi:titin